MRLLDHVLSEKERLEEEIHSLEKLLNSAPPGYLVCQKNCHRFKYYQILPDGPEKAGRTKIYLNKGKKELITALAQKALWKKQLIDDRFELKALHLYLRNHSGEPDRATRKLLQSQAFRELLFPNLASAIDRESALDWANADYEKNPDHPELLTVPTIAKEFVRSKSESFIAFQLHTHGIHFRYECKLQLRHCLFYPDFTFLHPVTGKVIIWEHFGLMDDPDYRRKTASKLRTYVENGYIPNQTLFMTFESADHPFDMQEIIFIIEKMILS